MQSSACPQPCPDCRQAEATEDNSGHDGDVLLRLLLKAVQDGDDRRNAAKRNGKSLLEAIRLLTEMDLEERGALIALLKALG